MMVIDQNPLSKKTTFYLLLILQSFAYNVSAYAQSTAQYQSKSYQNQSYQSFYGLSGGILFSERGELLADTQFWSLSGHLGAYFNQYFALEGRLSVGLSSDSVATGRNNTTTIEYDNSIGLYAKLHPFWMEGLGPYMLFGLSRIEFTEGNTSFFAIPTDATGWSFGFGVDYFLSNYMAIHLELAQLVDKPSVSAFTMQGGLTIFF